MKVSKEIIEKIKSLPTPKIIAVSGLGGSGKSSIAKELGVALGAHWNGVWKNNDLQYLETCKPQEKADAVISNS